MIRQVAALCIDIHGQHENQSLLQKDKHLAIVDEFATKQCVALKQEIAALYREYTALKKQWQDEDVSDEERARELSFLEYEKREIEQASLHAGEIEEVEEAYRRASGAETIVESLSLVHRLTSDTAAGAVSHALQSMQRITGFGEEIQNLQEELLQIEGLLDDFNHETADYMQDFSFDANEFSELERRLDTIHNLQAKYGSTYEEILSHLEEVEDKLQKFADFEQYKEKLLAKIKVYESDLTKKCEQLSKERKETASVLQEKIKAALSDLNFAYVDFEIAWNRKDTFGADGWDEAEFLMAIKSVFAEKDHIETLIFDEIDAGISGRTAQKVSEKLKLLSKSHQILCITHLAQIAAMADTHFLIEKMVDENYSETVIRPLDKSQSEQELARILGGVEITESVLENAREMKALANKISSDSFQN